MPVFTQRVFLVSVVFLAGGCVTAPEPDAFNALQRQLLAMAHAREEYTLQPGDLVRVTLYRGGTVATEFSGDITVQPDGKVSLIRLERPLDTKGLSVQELQAKVNEAYYPLFGSTTGDSDFRATVQFVSSVKTQWTPDQVYVLGEVRRAQAVPYRKGMTVLEALSFAGGPLVTGQWERVVLLRNADGKTITREFDFEAVVEHEGDDMEVFPNDVIYVPLSGISIVDIWVDQYVRQLLPINPSSFVRLAQ